MERRVGSYYGPLRFHIPSCSGVGVALVEIAIGLLVTAGLLTRAAASVGLALNLLLFLTNSWHTYPYFLGSDIVFVFAWLPFVVVGATRQPTLEAVLRRLVVKATAGGGRPATFGEPALTRPAAMGATAVTTPAIAGLSVLLRGSYRSPQPPSSSASKGSRSVSRRKRSSSRPGRSTSSAQASLPHGAVRLGRASRLATGQAATYNDPSNGQPDIVIRQSNGSLIAHSAVCTHAGCTVSYQGGQIVCPCHASVDDAQTGAVITGPATAPLAPRKVIQRAGEIYALPA